MANKFSGRWRARGFTLVELMVALAVFAILTAIAYPMYQEQVRKSRRAAVKGAMLQVSQFMERNYTETRRYDQDSGGGNITNIGYVFNSTTSFIDPDQRNAIDNYYTLTLTTTANGYTVQAVPKGGQSEDKCATLGLDNVGNKTTSSVHDCW
ncbi:MAG: type IV pilin protein [Gammaproteobacteria bacterium]|nr:type IV pilin protein [Gammaproteobacteria bacterium]